ncbi:membrane protein, partial [Streptomyces sp. NRRL F-4711]
LTVETYTGNASAAPTPGTAPSAGVLIGWALTALGLALAGPGLTHLCGRLLQAVRPGALRLLAGRVLMEESHRVGRPLGVVAAVAAAAYVAATVYDGDGPAFGPLATLGASLVAGCTVATLLTAAVAARHARAGTTDALLRLGAPPATLRGAAAVRAAALLALFGPLTLLVAVLAALPLEH